MKLAKVKLMEWRDLGRSFRKSKGQGRQVAHDNDMPPIETSTKQVMDA